MGVVFGFRGQGQVSECESGLGFRIRVGFRNRGRASGRGQFSGLLSGSGFKTGVGIGFWDKVEFRNGVGVSFRDGVEVGFQDVGQGRGGVLEWGLGSGFKVRIWFHGRVS